MQVQGSAVERARRSTVLPDVAIEAIRRQVQQREPAPSRLLPFDCKRWYNTEEPLQVDQLEGQSVLLCLGYSPLPLPLLEVCHQVYGQRGLAVIHVGLSVADGKGMGESFEEMFRKRNPSFPVGHDTGATMKRYGVTNSRILLYDQHHQLVSDSINPHDFRAIRNHMLSSHD
jgi:hypothetical protein